MVAVGANGLSKITVSGGPGLRTDMGIVMAAAVVAATLGATVLAPTNMLMGFSNKFMEFPSAETDGPPNNMELEVACPPFLSRVFRPSLELEITNSDLQTWLEKTVAGLRWDFPAHSQPLVP